MMRNRLLVVLALVVGVATLGVASAQAERQTIYLAFVSNNSHEFWNIADRGTQKAASDLGARVEFRRPQRGTAAEQKQIVEDLIAKGVQGIAISPNDAVNQADFFNHDVATKIPLICSDSDLPEGSKRLCYVGTDNFAAGRAAGELLKQALPSGGQVIIFVGKLDVRNAVERRAGVIAALGGFATFAEAHQAASGRYPLRLGSYEVLGVMTDDAKKEKCKANAEDALTRYPRLAGMVGLWEYNPPAILAAVSEARLLGRVKIVGFDENEETLQGVIDGHIAGTIVQNPFEFGYQSIKLLHQVVQGDRSGIPEGGVVHVPHRVITPGNVAEFRTELRRLKGKP
ncbi:MAG TPA: sugar-binding protein [Gemmatales bacterium]|nr:sugar-binding protein [Gemmatales bacterium]HMP57921.1 sugar-binding protein [Gemmatales bacterium]